MKKLLLLLSVLLSTACTVNNLPTYHRDTLLGLDVSKAPSLPECTKDQIDERKTEHRCQFLWKGSTEILIPEAENGFPFAISPITYSRSDRSYLVNPKNAQDINIIRKYFVSRYGNPKSLGKKIGFDVYEFKTRNTRIEFWYAKRNPSDYDAIAIYYFPRR